MSRKRLSWLKKSDPYTMNQEREQPAADDYWTGGPSEFAETPHPELPDDPGLGRDEIGRPNMSERNLDSKNVDEWGKDDGRPYDNQPYWPDAGPTARQKGRQGRRSRLRRQRRAESKPQQRQSARDMYSRLKKKAFQCVKISSALLPSASESTIEEQAFELMALPDDVVISTAIRLSDEDEKKDKDKEKGEKKDDKKDKDKKKKKDDKHKEKKEADLMLQEMLNEERMAEGDDDDDEYDKKEKKEKKKKDDDEKESAESMEIDQMVNEMMGEGTRQSEHGQQPRQPQQPAPAPQPSGNTDFDIELEPMMNTVSTEDVSLEQDATLQQIWGETIPEGARESQTQETVNSVADRSASQQGSRRRTAHNQGVQTLGGGVKQSNQSDDEFDLSKLWSHAPDVSDVMNE